jgi:putative colanic acid biosynthesis UDP-glucose lipid carrier transferase
MVFVCDIIVLNLAFYITILSTGCGTQLKNRWTWLMFVMAFAVSELVLPMQRNYRFFYIDRTLLLVVKISSVIICVYSLLLFIFGIDVSVGVLLVLGAFTFAFLSVGRISIGIFLRKLRRMGLNFRRVVIVGAGKNARAVIHQLNSDAGFGYRLMGVFDDNPDEIEKNFYLNFWGSFETLDSFVRTNRIDSIYYTKDAADESRFQQVMSLADELGVEFIYVPSFNQKLVGQFEQSQVGSIPCLEHTFTPLSRGVNPYIKRLFDLAVSIPFLIVSPLIFIPLAIVIKVSSPGPVFFKQKRTGIHGSEFVCYKLRTMRVNDDSDKVQATADDPRKTKVGDFLRRTSLDELPQFFNVFLGNMSVVGPRPHMINHTEEYMNLINNYMIRHAVKPGITGWAQVNGFRGGTQHLWQMEKRVEYDVWYICNWNIFLDIKIVAKTIINAFKGEENAY